VDRTAAIRSGALAADATPEDHVNTSFADGLLSTTLSGGTAALPEAEKRVLFSLCSGEDRDAWLMHSKRAK
jgi:hypothetical protein